MVFAYLFVGLSDVPLIDLLARIPVYIVPFMMATIINKYNLREMELLWKTIFVIFIVNLFSNYLIFFRDPDIFERLQFDDANSGWGTNAGGSTFVLQCLFISAIMWVAHVLTKNIKTRTYTLIFIFIIFVYMMFMNSRGTAMVIWFFMALLFYLNKKGILKNSSMKSIIIWSGILILVAVIFSTQLLDLFMQIFAGSERLNTRLGDMKEIADGESIETMDASIGLRYVLWNTSINTFLSGATNFLIGVGEHVHDPDFRSLVESGVGGHSGFFDLAATYGMLGLVIIFNYLKNTFAYIKILLYSNEETLLLNIIFLAFVIYCCFNLMLIANFLCVITIFLPLTIILINNKRL